MRFFAVISVLLMAMSAGAWTKLGTVYTTDGSQGDVVSALSDSSANDTVKVPSGNFTWGTNGVSVQMAKVGVTLIGAGGSNTIINISSALNTSAALVLAANGVTISGIVESQNGAAHTEAIYVGAITNFCITNCIINDASTAGYMIETSQGSYGLITHNIFHGANGSHESIFQRGPNGAWNTNNTLGTWQNLFIENNYYDGAQYCDEGDANSQIVFRYNTIAGPCQVDTHMIETSQGTDSQPAGCRNFECYGNTWTYNANYWQAADLFGGTTIIFNNTATNTPWIGIGEYGAYENNNNAWGVKYITPTFYPAPDQPGSGYYPTSVVSATLGGNIHTFTNHPTAFASYAAKEPCYFWNNVQNTGGAGSGAANADWAITPKAIPQAAINQYTNETGNVASTYAMNDIVKADRDYFDGALGSTFTGTTGVGIGSHAQMMAITATITNVGFVSTNESSWNTTQPANTSPVLYRWNGSTWVLYYTPYTYPYGLGTNNPVATPPPGVLQYRGP